MKPTESIDRVISSLSWLCIAAILAATFLAYNGKGDTAVIGSIIAIGSAAGGALGALLVNVSQHSLPPNSKTDTVVATTTTTGESNV